jgi:hypothetical protein
MFPDPEIGEFRSGSFEICQHTTFLFEHFENPGLVGVE